MEAILVKVFATALALSQVMARPDAVKTEFDPVADQAKVVQILGDGCANIKKAFDIDNLDLDDLIETVMIDTRANADEVQGFRGLKFSDLHLAYRQICKRETIANGAVDIGEVIAYYNRTAANLPDHNRLKDLKLPGLSTVLDIKGSRYAELFEPDNRRISVPLSEIPKHVQQAFIAAEDKRFYEHKGVDERSVIRAFINTLADPKKRQGGSTITQQVAKNLLVGDDLTYERKIREILVASRVEQTISKPEILEVYLNAIFLGRSSWGIEMAAKSYFRKSAKDLTLAEGAFLAGLTKGPNFYNPDRHRARAHERLAYVLDRMREDGAIDDEQMKAATANPMALAALDRPRRTSGFHLVDHLRREANTIPGIGSLTATSYSVRSTIHPQLQRAAETALQNGLARYEQSVRRTGSYQGPEANLADAIKRLQGNPAAQQGKPAWQQALEAVRLPLYDVHWNPAVVVEKVPMKGFDSIRVGLTDGRVLPLSTSSAEARRLLAVNDVIYVSVVETKTKAKDGKFHESVRVDMRSRPTVQGAAVVLENATGRILAMVGGFSFPLSQLNRTTQTRRQPGSSLKPLTYLAALSAGLQPNTLVSDSPLTLPPMGDTRYAQAKDWWSPKNYDGGYGGPMTIRRALEASKNLVTARLLDGAIAATPQESLDQVCRLAVEARLYDKCERYYPFVLGAQPVRLLDLAAFYAAIANEGGRPTPHAIDTIERNGETVYSNPKRLISMASADRPANYQLKSILQGVLSRGTARSIGHLAPFVAGKTGTSDEENDAWFVGFSNDVTIAVWVGYDNARGKRTLGGGQTGGKIAVPIFEPIMQAVWELHAPKTALRGPSPQASRQLIALPINLQSGDQLSSSNRSGGGSSSGAFTEYFRLDANGRFTETHNRLVSRSDYLYSDGSDYWERQFPGGDGDRSYRYGNERYFPGGQPPSRYEEPRRQPSAPGLFGLFAPLFESQRPQYVPQERMVSPQQQYQQQQYRSAPPQQQQPQYREREQYRAAPQPRRAEPDYYWGNGRRTY